MLLGIAPVMFGVYFNALASGVVGAAITMLSFLVVWFYGQYREMNQRRDAEEKLRKLAEAEQNSYELRYRVAKSRQDELQEDATALRQEIAEKTVEIVNLQQEAGKRSALIGSLQQRILNLNEEINGVPYGGKKTTTLEDVKKLTGET